jgi:plastocyanin
MSIKSQKSFFSAGLIYALLGNILNGYAGEATIEVSNLQGAPIKNAVISLESEIKTLTKPPANAVISQKNKTFIPLVSIIQTGASVTFPNKDSVRHHVYSFSPAKKFELKLYSGVPSTPVIFDQAGAVVLGCNIHDSMLAYIYIVDTPYFAKTEVDGKAKLENLPEGNYKLTVLHPDLLSEGDAFTQQIVIKESQVIAVKLNIKS